MQGQLVQREIQDDDNVLRKHKYASMTLHDAARMLGGEHFTAMITEFIYANRELKQDECFRLANASINCIKSMLVSIDVANDISHDDSTFDFMQPLFDQAKKIYPDELQSPSKES